MGKSKEAQIVVRIPHALDQKIKKLAAAAGLKKAPWVRQKLTKLIEEGDRLDAIEKEVKALARSVHRIAYSEDE